MHTPGTPMVGARIRSFAFLISLVLAGLFVGWTSTVIDGRVGFPHLLSYPTNLSGLLLIAVGSSLRFWAGLLFYRQNPSMVSFKSSTDPPYHRSLEVF